MNRFDGFHEFVVARGGALSRTAFLLTGEHHAAEDLVQSALAKAATRWRQIMEYGQPEAYIRRIMINEHISWWRRRPARPMAQVPEWPGPDEPRQVVDRVVLGRALDTLAPRQRAVVVLRYYEDLTEAETAAAMGCSIGTVKSQAHAALGKLRAALPMFAEQAGQYADAESAVSRARRSRARRVAVGAALAVLPLALAAVVFVLRGGGETAPPPLTGTPSPSPSVAAPVRPPLPTAVPAIGPAVAALPADRGVGPASLVRYGAAAEPGRVQIDVLAGGTWYRKTVPDIRILFPVEVSPDGRWLVWFTGGNATVRDLTGTVESTLRGVSVVRWSPSGNRVLGYRPATDGFALYTVPQWSETGAMRREAGWNVTGVLDSGEVLRMSTAGQDARLGAEAVDPATGTARAITLDLRAALRPDELVRRHFAPLGTSMYATAGDTVAVEVRRAPSGYGTVAYVQVSLADGRVVRRQDVPAGQDSPASRLCLRGPELIRQVDGALYVQPDPGARTVAVVVPPGRYRVPGCWPLI